MTKGYIIIFWVILQLMLYLMEMYLLTFFFLYHLLESRNKIDHTNFQVGV